MALQLEELQWGVPLVPERTDPAWEAELCALFGGLPKCARSVAWSEWVRGLYVDCVRCPVDSLTRAEVELAGLLTSQENACRYCYGSARARMKLIGFTDRMIDRIEQSAQLVEADPKERELVHFCRALARSKPRPSRQAREQLHAVGYTQKQTAELAFVVAAVGYCNRVSTLLAVPIEVEMEAEGKPLKGLWDKLTSWLPSKGLPVFPRVDYPAPTFAGPLGPVVRGLDGSPTAAMLEAMVKQAFEPSALPMRSKALLFAVIARALQCEICEPASVELLKAEGFSSSAVAEVLSTLSSPELTDVEARLVPWARDTVWMPEQPKSIQERTRPLVDALGPQVVVEAVGTAALANGCVRLAMLLQ